MAITETNQYTAEQLLRELIAAHADGKLAINIIAGSANVKTLVDINADGYKYIGEAPAGTATSAAAWSITRISSVNPQAFLISPANSVWDDRATTVTYS